MGKGQLGMVKLATHKVTGGVQTAIKTVEKGEKNEAEQRRESEVLKMCQHRNIIRLIVDLFENSDETYFIIVLDYMQGKNHLFDYI